LFSFVKQLYLNVIQGCLARRLRQFPWPATNPWLPYSGGAPRPPVIEPRLRLAPVFLRGVAYGAVLAPVLLLPVLLLPVLRREDDEQPP
jgi:hypothetical protein